MSEHKKEPGIFSNWISLLGAVLSSAIFTAILTLIGIEWFSQSSSPYLGIVTYVILPSLLTPSLIAIVIGALIERGRRRRHDPKAISPFLVVDFNLERHRRVFVVAAAVVAAFLLFSMFGSYKAYHFTESVTFCGVTCHEVMEPEYTAYRHSPHARVACVQCHIGPGADWFVRSKLSGAYQVYSVLFNKYSRPIETPIKNLRPAQETCEQCHWPKQFFGAVENDHRYFLSDEGNTPWETRMLVLVGGGERSIDERKGIHWHMNIANKIYYIATDEKRQEIPWIKVVHPDGSETVYVDKDSDYSAENPPQGELRRMDCIDCHNRPSHNFKSPQRSVNDAMARGDVSPRLPFIKREALKVLSKKYESKDAGLKAIEDHLRSFYGKQYSEAVASLGGELDLAIETMQQIYRENFFPGMGVRWELYPENIGHLTAPGCFRCHNGLHESAGGKRIENNCNSCHMIIAQGSPGTIESSVEGLAFKHPGADADVDDMWQEMLCSDCHTGGPM